MSIEWVMLSNHLRAQIYQVLFFIFYLFCLFFVFLFVYLIQSLISFFYNTVVLSISCKHLENHVRQCCNFYFNHPKIIQKTHEKKSLLCVFILFTLFFLPSSECTVILFYLFIISMWRAFPSYAFRGGPLEKNSSQFFPTENVIFSSLLKNIFTSFGFLVASLFFQYLKYIVMLFSGALGL